MECGKKLKNKRMVEMVKTKGTREWSSSSVNIFFGCENNCSYCYAKKIAYRFKRLDNLENWKTMTLNEKAIKKQYHKRDGVIMFPTAHDLPAREPFLSAWLNVLRKILDHGNSVLITTKPRIDSIVKIIHGFNMYKTRIEFRFTITSVQDDILKKYTYGKNEMIKTDNYGNSLGGERTPSQNSEDKAYSDIFKEMLYLENLKGLQDRTKYCLINIWIKNLDALVNLLSFDSKDDFLSEFSSILTKNLRSTDVYLKIEESKKEIHRNEHELDKPQGFVVTPQKVESLGDPCPPKAGEVSARCARRARRRS